MNEKKKPPLLDIDMVTPKTWEEFRDTGLLWFINGILNVFGWGIIAGLDDEGNLIEMLPVRTKYRGFETVLNDEGYMKVSEYLKDNAKEIYDEVL